MYCIPGTNLVKWYHGYIIRLRVTLRRSFQYCVKRFFISFLTFSLFLPQFSFLVPSVYAATSPWTQTDWSGGSGQTSWSDVTKFDSSSNVTTSTAGQVTLTNTEKLSNTGFESDLSSWNTTQDYTLNDQFTTARSAGAVNGTSAEPTGGIRTVTDTNSKLSITGGVLSSATGGASNDGVWYSSLARASGKTLLAKVIPSDTNGVINVGWDTNTSGAVNDRLVFAASGVLQIVPNGGTTITVGSYTATTYYVAGDMRATGFHWFIKGGAFTSWTLLWITAAGTAAGIPSINIGSTTSIFTTDDASVPSTTYTPVPLVSDGFSASTTDGLGNEENNGPVGTTWTGSTWIVAGGSVSNTPTVGSEAVVNGNFEGSFSSGLAASWTKNGTPTVSQETTTIHGGSNSQKIVTGGTDQGIYQSAGVTGNWYTGSAWVNVETAASTASLVIGQNNAHGFQNSSAVGSWEQLAATGRGVVSRPYIRTQASGVTFYVDDVSMKPLTLSSLFRSVNAGSADVLAEAAVTGPTSTSGIQGGLVLNLDSASSPANFIIVYLDAGQVRVDEAVAGVYTNKQNTAVTYSAGAVLRAVRDGTKLRVYYNNALVGSELTMTANTNTLHGLFSTSSTNTFDNFAVWARSGYADAPFDDLTITRDTTTTYSSSAGSAKLVSTTDNTFTQSVNVGDTNSYNLSTYAYTDGSAVTSSDLGLYANGSAVTTTYTSVGGGWYQLIGTVTGVASSVGYGVKVKAGKTVYVDNVSLNNYAASGTLTSSIFDSGQASTWGTLTYSATTPSNTSVSVKIRTSNASDMSGATAFASCTAISSASDISSNSCVTDNQRYVQYLLTLSNTDYVSTPTFDSLQLSFTQRNVAVTLDSPNDNIYTTLERPAFRWKTGTDATIDISSYTLSLDNGDTGDFNIDGIPINRTTDYDQNRYIAHYDNFSDSDSSNNYISVWTKSSSNWSSDTNSGNNDGKLKEGKLTWTVRAKDSTGVEYPGSRTLFVDQTGPASEITQVSNAVIPAQAGIHTDGSSRPRSEMTTEDNTPTVFGKITDPLAGDKDENKIAAGPKSVEIKLEKKNVFGFYNLHTLATITINDLSWVSDGSPITDNSQNKADKYSTFSFTPDESLSEGTYKITVTGKDKADNTGNPFTFNLIVTDRQELAKEPVISSSPLPALSPKIPVSPQPQAVESQKETVSALQKLLDSTFGLSRRIIDVIASGSEAISLQIQIVVSTTYGGFLEVTNAVGQKLTFAGETTGNIVRTSVRTYETNAAETSHFVRRIITVVGDEYNHLANTAPGMIKPVLTGVGNGVSIIVRALARTVGNGISGVAFTVGEKMDDVSHTFGTAIIKFGYLFVTEPTRIVNVRVVKSTPTSLTISWETNHPANGKVNYGLTADYGQDVQTDKRITNHEFIITGLKSNTTYYYEVMSQNRNYVYDANHTFTTPAQ